MTPGGPRFEDVTVPEPNDGEILVKVAGAGACHSDLHVMASAQSETSPWPDSFTLGHETTGWVEALGSNVRGIAIGDAVAIYSAWGCGACSSCRSGADNYCERSRELRGPGLGIDGGMAAYTIVRDARHLVPLRGLDPYDAAPLCDAGLTPYHAIASSRGLLQPTSVLAVIGIGGLGHMAVQIAKAIGASTIVAFDVASEKLDLARDLGADIAIRSDENAVAAFFDATHGRRADVAVDFAGVQGSIDLARKIVRPNGDVTIAGLGGGAVRVAPGAVPWGARIRIPLYGTIPELGEVLELARRRLIRAEVTKYALDDAPKAYDALREGSLRGRAVICPNG